MNQNKTQEVYQIRVKGRLDQSWSSWFDNMALTFENGVTTISGAVTDQAALHGLLAKVRDLGLTLIDVRHIDPGKDDERAVE
ncbi:MAG: hypothetical protein ACREOO_27445 [bacterium]